MTPTERDRLFLAIRSLQDSLPNSTAPDEVVSDARHALEQAAGLMEPYRFQPSSSAEWSIEVGEGGVRSLNPILLDAVWDEQHMRAKLVLTNFYHGSNGAAFGGSIPLLFDEVLGRLSVADGTMRRTAYLKVDFRSVTPVNAELDVECHLERAEGRKHWLRGTLRHGDTVCAEAEGLWIALRPGAL